jgi:hypothetical protein
MQAFMKNKLIIRNDVNLAFDDKSLDTFIGRAAHVSMISNHVVIDMICNRYLPFF